MTSCKIISGTYFDEDNGEYQSYGITVENGGEKIVVEDITVDHAKIEDLAGRIENMAYPYAMWRNTFTTGFARFIKDPPFDSMSNQ